jgi:hypothetical protein
MNLVLGDAVEEQNTNHSNAIGMVVRTFQSTPHSTFRVVLIFLSVGYSRKQCTTIGTSWLALIIANFKLSFLCKIFLFRNDTLCAPTNFNDPPNTTQL